MPVYQCYSPKGLLTQSVKATIAQEITAVHCNATAAPELFVNVVFHDISEDDCFVAGQLSTHSYVFGSIRHGRDLEIRQGMLRDISQMWTRLTGQSEAEVLVSLKEINSQDVMEGGLILPEPGNEQQWFDQNRERLGELGFIPEQHASDTPN